MTDKDSGGQAFPQQIAIGASGDVHPAYPGMTLRDWLAGQALAGMLANVQTQEALSEVASKNSSTFLHAGAQFAYEYADAMIAERAK